MIEIHKCRGRDIKSMKGKLRKEDFIELKRRTGMEPYKVLVDSYRSSEVSYAGFVNGKIACAWGVASGSIIGSQAQIWLLSTDAMGDAPLAVARKTKNELQKLLHYYSYLDNYVDAEYSKCIRWLKWLGFTVEKPQKLGVNGEEFCHFYIHNQQNNSRK